MTLESGYWTLVQAALWNRSVTPVKLSDDLQLLHRQQGTATLVFPMLEMSTEMKAVCVHNMQQQVKLQYTLSAAWSALLKAGIPTILMKGAGLAALYPDPNSRTWGDIDLFVGKTNYHPACAVMRDTFPDALKFDEELDHYKHYNLIADGISMEIHRLSVSLPHPVDAYRYARMEAFAVSHACDLETGGLHVKVFEPTFNALFVLLHAWEHMLSKGANVRQLCDIAMLLHHYASSIDRPRLKRYIKALHMMDVWQIFMYLLVQHVGLPADEAPFYSSRVSMRAERLLNDLMKGTLIAPTNDGPVPANRFARKWHTMQERMRNADRIANYSPAYARHMKAGIVLSGMMRLFAPDRRWE